MAESNIFPALSKAPITMAILELRYQAKEGLTNESLKGVKNSLKDEFPIHQFTTDAQFELRPDRTAVQLKSSHISGNLFFSTSRNKEISLSTSAYNFKQHGQYTTWENFRDSALSGWEKCKPVIEPHSIIWLSLRYINNIEIPILEDQSVPSESLFNTFIAYEGKNKTNSIATYALKYTHYHKDKNVMVHFGQELLPGKAGTLPFIVDVDVVHTQKYLANEINVSEKFEQLRQIKNEYFFDNLTATTLNLLK